MIVTEDYVKKHKPKEAVKLIVKGGKFNGHKYSIIGLSNKMHQEDPGFIGDSFHLPSGRFKILPVDYKTPVECLTGDDPDGDRDIMYFTGPSKAGKSYESASNAFLYNEKYPNNQVILISPQPPSNPTKDPMSLENLGCIFFDLRNTEVAQKNFVGTGKLRIEDLCDSLVIFDDFDSITDKKIKAGVQDLICQILKTGRHYRISSYIISHVPANRNETKQILIDTEWCCLFPESFRPSNMRYFCETYCNLPYKLLVELHKYATKNAQRCMYMHIHSVPCVVMPNAIFCC